MISLARVVLDQHEQAGRCDPSDFADIPPQQFSVYWSELSRICPSRIWPEVERQRNALRIEVLPSSGPRCARRSPDNRGYAWLESGGSAYAYGVCNAGSCPRALNDPHRPTAAGGDET